MHQPIDTGRFISICISCKNKINYYSTVKPLYSEQSRDPHFFSLYRGVHPIGVIYVHVYMCLKYNVHILKLICSCYGTHQVAELFSMTVFSFYIL